MKKAIVRRTMPAENFLEASVLHPVLRRIYCARGIKSSHELENNLTHLLPYQNLLGIEQAVICLADALMRQERLLIIGDFDADGATSTALAVSALRVLGACNVNYLVPNRFDFGYGLTPEIVEVAGELSPDIIITVDNGISSFAGVLAAKAKGIKVVITDHHLTGDSLPEADAIVNPQLPGDSFPSKSLAGVGVIFYVMLALRAELRSRGWFEQQTISDPNMAQFLDLVALGTVADLVPLDHNNRILVHQGVERIRAGKARPGIYALLKVAGRIYQRMVASDLGFSVGPRLNAAGRLSDMSLGIECLLCADQSQAYEMALKLNLLNEERKQIEQTMQGQALTVVNQFKEHTLNETTLPWGLCLFDESWHQGVIGLLASRLKEVVHRPVIAFAPANEDEMKGSARSIPHFHIRDALAVIHAKNPGLIERFGGHAMAAGLSIKKSAFPLFMSAFDSEVRRVLSEEHLQAKLFSDGELMGTDLQITLAKLLRTAGPFGQAFPEPQFDGEFSILQQNLIGGKHLKLLLNREGLNQPIEAIWFNVDLKSWPDKSVDKARLLYRLDVNEYMGRERVQLIVESIDIGVIER